MTTRIFAFPLLSAILISVFLSAALSAPAAATDVTFTDFEGAWSASLTYNPGAVVTYQGSSYVCITENTHIKPPDHTHYWAVLGTSGVFGANSVTYKATNGAGVTCDLGSLLLNASNILPPNYAPADGTLLSVSQNSALFGLLGTTYGGDGISTFGLPDLRAAAPNNTIYLICVNGDYP